MSLHDNLSQLRLSRGYQSAKDFAIQAGIPYSSYSAYERKAWPSEENLIKIARALHVSLDELVGFHVDLYERAESMLRSIGIDVTHDTGGVHLNIPSDIYACLSRQTQMFLENLAMHAATGQQQSLAVTLPVQTFHDFVDKSMETAIDESQKVLFNTFVGDFLAKVQWYHYEQTLRTAYQKGQPLTPFLGHNPFKEPDKADGTHADQANKKAANPKASGKQKKD